MCHLKYHFYNKANFILLKENFIILLMKQNSSYNLLTILVVYNYLLVFNTYFKGSFWLNRCLYHLYYFNDLGTIIQNLRPIYFNILLNSCHSWKYNLYRYIDINKSSVFGIVIKLRFFPNLVGINSNYTDIFFCFNICLLIFHNFYFSLGITECHRLTGL